MTDPIQQSAQHIIASMRRNFGATPTTRSAREEDFGHLDLRAYREFRSRHEALGFRFLWDFELAEVSDSPTTFVARTFIRAMVSADATIVAYYYQVRPRLDRLCRQLLRGLLNRRWIDAPRFFLRTLRTRHCSDYESECSDGSFITTSNAQSAGSISSPPTVSSEFHAYGTATEVLLDSQKRRLAGWAAAHPDGDLCRVTSLDGLRAMQARLKQQKNAHRMAVSWVTKAELVKMSGGNPALAEAVFAEVQRQLREATP